MGQVCGTEAVPIVEENSDFEEYFPDVQQRGEERAAKLAKAKALKRSREEAGNLRSTFKERLIREIINPCCPDGECLTLVLDSHSAKIVGSVAKTSDLLFPEGNIAIVTNLARKREPSPLMEAIYFISPTLDNVKRVISDFPEDSNERNMYYGVHIFFTSHAPTSLIEQLGTSPRLLQHLLTVEDANLGIIPFEPKVFHLNMPTTLVDLYSKSMNQRQRAESQYLIVNRLLSLCLSLHEYPLIRYRSDNSQSRSIAEMVQKRLNQHLSECQDFWYHGMDGGNDVQRSSLIIVDRREDLAAPLMHDVTVQSMYWDALEVTDDGIFSYMNDSKPVNYKLNNQDDEVWMDIRHDIFNDAKFKIIDMADKYLGEVSTEGLTSAEKFKREIEKSKKQGKLNAIKISLNSNTTALQTLTNDFERLIPICNLEAEIVTGVREKDSSYANVSHAMLWKSLKSLLGDVEVTIKEKLRLISLFMVKFDGLSLSELEALQTICEPPIMNISDLVNFSNLGARVRREGKPALRDKIEVKRYQDQIKERLDKGAFVVRTIEPKIYQVVKDHIEYKLSEDEFSFIVPPPPGYLEDPNAISGKKSSGLMSGFFGGKTSTPSTSHHKKGARSVRKHKLNLNMHGKDGDSKNVGKSKDKDSTLDVEFRGPRVIVFVIGGMTYSEMRCMHKVMAETKREVIIGSTHITTQKTFLNEVLNKLGTDAHDKSMNELDQINLDV
eukprot:g8634.t1